MKKIIVVLMSLMLMGCSQTEEIKMQPVVPEEKEALQEEMTSYKPYEQKPIFNEVDYDENFKGIEGCAVFYEANKDTYHIYNKALCEKKMSPYSTFKIISTLIGLSENAHLQVVLEEEEGMTLKEAFKKSYVKYYDKLISQFKKEEVQKVLNELQYGNTDLSAWDEKGHERFWLASSLEISPLEQVEVLHQIFEGQSSFEKNHIETLKEMMLIEDEKQYSLYGKTGSAKKEEAWFVGFIEAGKENTYFAVCIDDESQELAGAVAKEIAVDIINKHYIRR